VLKFLMVLFLAGMVAGCLPVGIRATNLPNYADAAPLPGAGDAAVGQDAFAPGRCGPGRAVV
jgi:hypothetical protein